MSPRLNELVPLKPGATPLPWQSEAMLALRHNNWKEQRRVIISAATGSGKGTLAASILVKLVWSGKACWFVVGDKRLIDDVVSRTIAIEPALYYGIVQGRTNETGRHCTFASLQTIANPERVKQLPIPSYIFVDEAHTFCCPSGKKILKYLDEVAPNCRIIYATATPFRNAGNGRTSGLGEIADAVIYELSLSDAINLGYLCPIEGYALPPRWPEGTEDVAKILDTDEHNDAVVAKHIEHRRDGKPTPGIAFCVSVQHAINLAARFERQGIRAAAVWDSSEGAGKCPDRDGRVAEAMAGRIEVLTNFRVLGTGFDWPACTICHLVTEIGSLGLYAQFIGRITRKGKPKGIVLDYCGNAARHNLVNPANLTIPPTKGPRIEEGMIVRHRTDGAMSEGIVTEIDADMMCLVRWRGGAGESWHAEADLVMVRDRAKTEPLIIRSKIDGVDQYKIDMMGGVDWFAHNDTRTASTGIGRFHIRQGTKGWDVWLVPEGKRGEGEPVPTLLRERLGAANIAIAWAAAEIEARGAKVQAIDADWKTNPATKKQGGYLKYLGLRRSIEGMSAGTASALIDAQSCIRAVREHLEPGWLAKEEARRAKFSGRGAA